jgi:hypothetical protein
LNENFSPKSNVIKIEHNDSEMPSYEAAIRITEGQTSAFHQSSFKKASISKSYRSSMGSEAQTVSHYKTESKKQLIHKVHRLNLFNPT